MKILNYFIFSNLYVAMIAIVLCGGTLYFFHLPINNNLLCFVFWATMSSYSLHWYLTKVEKNTPRQTWTNQHRRSLKAIFMFSLLGIVVTIFPLFSLWKMLFPLAFFTFFYTAPKIPHPFFAPLRGFAFAKTLYLSSVWLCVTVFLPLYQAQIPFSQEHWLFAFNRFLIIFGVSMIFDFRDRNEDFGIKNWITYFDEKELSIALYLIFICFIISALYCISQLQIIQIIAFIFPMLLLLTTLNISKKTNNDYWFYVFLDGIVLLSGASLWLS
jgi:hypothetical protein